MNGQSLVAPGAILLVFGFLFLLFSSGIFNTVQNYNENVFHPWDVVFIVSGIVLLIAGAVIDAAGPRIKTR
jgi:uncharacterized membrane protein HdeD (DUF308 family)